MNFNNQVFTIYGTYINVLIGNHIIRICIIWTYEQLDYGNNWKYLLKRRKYNFQINSFCAVINIITTINWLDNNN